MLSGRRCSDAWEHPGGRGLPSPAEPADSPARTKKPSRMGGPFCTDWAACRKGLAPLFRRGRREPFASAAGFWFRLRFGRLLLFLLAFVFASHGSKCATKGHSGERTKCRRATKRALARVKREGWFPACYSPAPPAGLTRTCWGASTFAEETANWSFMVWT